MSTTMPMLAPDGTSGDIPVSRASEAMAAGFKPATEMTSPDGKAGYIPRDNVPAAMKAGFKPTPDATSQPGFWENLGHAFGIGSQENEATIQKLQQHPIQSAVDSYPPVALAEGLYHGAQRIGGELKQGLESASQGNYAGAAAHAIIALPFVGAAVERADAETPASAPGRSYAGQVLDALTPGNLGTAVGTAAQVAPMLLSGADMAMPERPMVPNPPVGQALGRAVLLGRTPEGAYQSALKPSTTLPAAQRANIVQTGLENGIPVSQAGIEKIGDLINDLNQKITETIDNAGPARTINPSKAVQNLATTRARFANQVNPTNDLNAINASGEEFLNQFRNQSGGAVRNMSAADAQAMKQGTYRVLAEKYGEQGSASVEAQKALARGLKEEIASQFPEINNLNATESRLLDLQPVLEKAVNRISNQQSVGIGTPILGAGVKAVTGNTALGAVSAVMKAVFDNPIVKSRLAIAVSKANKIPISEAASRVNSYSTSLGSAAGATAAYSSGGNQNQSTIPQP